MEERPAIWKVALNKLNRQPTRGGPPAWGLGEVLATPSRENIHVMNYSQYEMLPLEIKQSGGKLLPHSVLRGAECFQREYLEVFKSGKGTFC
jgi:hypothetical protein